MNCWTDQQSSRTGLRQTLCGSHVLSRPPSSNDTSRTMLLRILCLYPVEGGGRERESNGTLKRSQTKNKTKQSGIQQRFLWEQMSCCCFFCSCMSNAYMEEGGGCRGNRRRIHRRLNLLLSSAVIERNKDRTQYRVLTPQHSRNE